MCFEETMIDHLEIESQVVDVNSKEGKEQVLKFGIPPPWTGKDS